MEYELELRKQHWENARHDNVNIVLQNKYSTEIALEAIKLCDEKIAEFPEEEVEETPKKAKS